MATKKNVTNVYKAPAQARVVKKITLEQAMESVKFLADYVTDFTAAARAKDRHDVTSAIRLFDEIDKLKDAVKGLVKTPLEEAYDVLRFAVIPELMQDAEMTTVRIEGIGRCTVSDDINATAVAEFKENLYQWLIDHEMEDMITRQVNAQTLAAFVRRRMKAGEELPTDYLKITPFTRASITRS